MNIKTAFMGLEGFSSLLKFVVKRYPKQRFLFSSFLILDMVCLNHNIKPQDKVTIIILHAKLL